jgi:hypothetical protein
VVAAEVAPKYAFGRRPPGQFLIEMGYVVLAILVMGAILGAWR